MRGKTLGWLLFVSACTVGPASSSDDGSGSSGVTASETSSASGTESTPTEVTTMSTESGMDTTAGTGEPDMCTFPAPEAIECQPPGTTEVDFAVLMGGVPAAEVEIEQTCTVTDTTDDGVVYALQLDCPTEPLEIQISSTPHQGLALDMGVEVDVYFSSWLEDEINYARHLALRHGGGTLAFAAFDASTIPSPAKLDVTPLVIELPPTTCDPTATEFGIDIQRAALRVTFDGSTVDVFGGGDALVGSMSSYRILTGDLERIQCFPDDAGYNYADWFVRAAMFQIPEG